MSSETLEFLAFQHYENQAKKNARQEKLQYIIDAIKEASKYTDEPLDITPLCNNLKIKLTAEEFNWILEQVQED